MTGFATQPTNVWGIKIPAAVYGAQQLPIPQAMSPAEARSTAFRDKLAAAHTAQLSANAAARRARDDGHPPAAAVEAGSVAPGRSTADPYADGAAAARAILLPQGAGSAPADQAADAASHTSEAAHAASERERGAAAARKLLGKP